MAQNSQKSKPAKLSGPTEESIVYFLPISIDSMETNLNSTANQEMEDYKSSSSKELTVLAESPL